MNKNNKIKNEVDDLLWQSKTELKALAALFRNLKTADFSESEFYGISLIIEKIAQDLEYKSD